MNIIIQVNSINNPPYNSSFNDIGIQIQNSAGNYMQVCNFKQQAVNTLKKSSSFNLLNWNSQIGAQSNVAATLIHFLHLIVINYYLFILLIGYLLSKHQLQV